MAVVNKYMQEEQQRINNQRAQSQGGTSKTYNISPISQQKKAQITTVTQPAATYTAGVNPGAYTSRFQGALDSILAQIQNPDAFHYEFNGDELFKSYADQYTQRGKQASLDAMGQAAGLTGGYGNSYGQQVGQQTYQNYLLGLYDKGFDLRNAAYGQYRDEMGDLVNTYNQMLAAEQADYGRYQDALSAWQEAERLAEQRREFDLDYELAKRKYEESLAAQAAASSGGGGSNNGGGGTTYTYMNGNLYLKDNKTGAMVKVSANQYDKAKDKVDYTVQNQLDHRRKNLGR